MPEEALYGIPYMEYDSPEAAARSARRYEKCPHVAFWAAKGRGGYILLAVNENKKFWAEYISEHPRETFGGVKADLVFPDEVYAPLPKRKLPDELLEISPCGSDCATCPAYDNCPGCPATVHYKGLANPVYATINVKYN